MYAEPFMSVAMVLTLAKAPETSSTAGLPGGTKRCSEPIYLAVPEIDQCLKADGGGTMYLINQKPNSTMPREFCTNFKPSTRH
uniref:Uncharacterized protein n=1 Tax=Rhizophora mucronata TaxID=61149 RepID=A0A2P2K0U0_RHIMU